VVNQAGVHRWRPVRAPHTSLVDGIASWPEVVTCVAVTLHADGRVGVIAPYGLDDLFAQVVRPNPRCLSPGAFAERRWRKRWGEEWRGCALRRGDVQRWPGFVPLEPGDASLQTAVAAVARRFVLAAWAERFCHEASRKPERLMYRVSHRVADLFPSSMRGGGPGSMPIGTFGADLTGSWFVACGPVDVAAVAAREGAILLLAPGGDAVVAVSEEGALYGGTWG
jgi:hypothetical protein